MSETKTLVFPDGNGTNGLDPNLLLAMNGGGFGNNFGNGGWLWILFLFAMMNGGWGNGFGFGGNGNALNNDAGRQLLMQAIQGNGNAIAQLASTFNCSIGQVQAAINNVQGTIQQGDAAILQKLNDCCCENRLAICNQTNTLSNAMNANTQAIIAKLDAAETRALTDKIDALREQNSSLTNQLSQEHQTLQFGQMIQAATTPIASAVNALQSDVDGIKCKLPQTVTLPFSQATAVPNCYAYGLGYGLGCGCFGGFNNGSLWG